MFLKNVKKYSCTITVNTCMSSVKNTCICESLPIHNSSRAKILKFDV